jgi:hypothetical protein
MATQKVCSMLGCDKTVRAQGLCATHYDKRQRSDDPLPRKRASNGAHLAWLKMHTAYDGADCLIWPFPKSGTRYGVTQFRGQTMHPARVMCILVHGEPPVRKETAHSCGKGLLGCVNPQHLRWATRRENIDDMQKHGTTMRGEQNFSAKLSELNVRHIRALALQGVTRNAIAEMFGVSHRTVSSIITGRTWAWLK